MSSGFCHSLKIGQCIYHSLQLGIASITDIFFYKNYFQTYRDFYNVVSWKYQPEGKTGQTSGDPFLIIHWVSTSILES